LVLLGLLILSRILWPEPSHRSPEADISRPEAAISRLGGSVRVVDGEIVDVDFHTELRTDYHTSFNAGLKELKELKNLRELFLGGTVTDAGLKELKEVKSLQFLFIGSPQVTAAGVKELKAALPGLKIEGSAAWTEIVR